MSCARRNPTPALLALAALAAACGGSPSNPVPASPTAPLDLAQPWTVAAPAEVGMRVEALVRADAHAAGLVRARSLLVARHGKLVLERYYAGAGADTRFDVRSVTKSVVSALTGIALEEGSLPGLDALVAPYLEPPYRFDAEGSSTTVRHLLTMTSGYRWNDDVDYDPWIRSDDHVQVLLDRPHDQPPGTSFTYNSAAAHTLGVVLQRATDTRLPEYAASRLFEPLGVGPDAVGWESLDRGTVNGGAGLQLRSRDLLKLGQLYLQKGLSGGRSLVPESWVDATTQPQFAWREAYGAQTSVTYGMLWWVSDGPTPAFFAWGYGGQFVYVAPSLDLVIVSTTEWRGLEAAAARSLGEDLLDVFVEDVLPAAS